MTWEDLVSNAKKNNANLAKSQRSAGDITSKSTWEDLVYAATRTNVDILKEKQEEYKKTDEYKFAKENETRLRSGLGYNVNNGQIYSFEPLTKESLKKSISWADSEIEKLKKQGGTSNPLWNIVANIGNTGNDVRATAKGKEISDASEEIKELEGKRAVYQKYLENAEYDEAMKDIQDNGDGELFRELYDIDSRKATLLDALSNIGSGGSILPSGNSNDIQREEELRRQLQDKYGEKLNKYRELYAKGTNEEFRQHLVNKMKEDIEKHPVFGTVGYTLGNVATAPVRGIGALSDSINKAMGNYGAASGGIFQDMSEATVQKVNENINEKFKNPHAAGLVRTLYNAAVSGAESMLTMGTFGKLGEAVLGLNAATSTYKAGKERGLSDGQALAMGVSAGIFESLFEHISLDKLRAFQASPTTSLKPFIKNVLKQAGVEGIEELSTDIANEAYDYFVNGGLSEYEQALRSGMTADEYGKQFGLQLLETFATGALSGGGMIGVSAAPTAVMGSVAQNSADRKNGSKIRSEGEVEKLFNEAKGQGGSVGRNAAKLEKQIADGKKVSDRKIGQLDRKTTKAEREKAVDGILSSADYKEVSGKEKRAIRSSVLTYLSTGGEVSYEQKQVLDTENGAKVLEAAQKWEIDKVLKIGSERAERRSTNIRKAVEEHSTEGLVKHTFSAVNAEGHKVNVGAVRSITDGEFEVVQDTETGATVKLSEIKIDDRQAMELYRNLQELATGENPLTVEAVNVALSMYNTLDNTSARAYSLWVHDAYKAGALNIKDTVLSFSEFEEMFRNKYKADITKEQLREFYEIGARNLKVKPGVTRIGRKGLSKFQAEQVFILHERAKALGLEIVLTDGQLSDENGKDINALYVEGTNRIVMSLKSDLNLVLVHAGHEIFHWAKNQNREGGAFLQDMVINVLKADSKYDFDGIYKQVSAEYEGLSEEDMLEEIAAQYLGVVFANEDGIRKTVAAATAKQRSFLKKMVDYLRDFIKSLKKLIDLYGDSDKAVRAAVETPVDQLQYIADTFDEILKKTAEIKKPATEEGGVKTSRRLKETDLSSYLKAGNRQNKTKATALENNQKIILTTEEEITDYINDSVDKKHNGVTVAYGVVNSRLAQDVSEMSSGKIDITDYYLEFVPFDLQHAFEQHHIAKEEGDVDLSREDFEKIPEYIDNYDELLYARRYSSGNTRICVSKKISNGRMLIIETVSKSRGAMQFKNAIGVSEKKYYSEYKKESGENSRGNESSNISLRDSTAFNNTVPQNAQSVNNNDMQNKKKDTKKYSVKRDVDGNKFVDVDPTLFDARDGESHAKTIARIIKDRFNNLISVNGQQIQINKTTNREWLRSESATYLAEKHPSLYLDKLKTIPYADEILKAANNWIGEKPNHKRKDDIVEFARGEVLYRVGDNGYIADVLVGIRSNGAAVLYSLKNIYEKEITDISLAMASKSPQRSEEISVTDNISQSTSAVNTKFSRQRINESWEDIRTKMYESEVHEEIIGEIEDHIKSIKKKKLTRETIITDGLIPKYDKIFEVARSYTRGSKVKTYELANAIHEMMWAAYDGDLDTNQFIATVKIFAENIIRTGHEVNDDLYRQYEEFRKMTREETVHVSQQVYDQYVEKYGSVKNLNRACAGKIKIKPYDNTNRNGRALDDFYGELQELYPEMFKDDVDIYHQLNEILVVWSRIQPTVEYSSDKYGIKTEADIQYQALEMAEDILADIMGIKEKMKTLADRYAAKAVRNLNYYRVKEAEGRRKRRESEEISVLNKRILRNTNRLSDMLRNETDERHIPEDFKEAVMGFLNIFISKNDEGRDVYHIKNGVLNMVELGNAYASYYNPAGEEGREMTQYDEDIARWIKELAIVFGDEIDIKTLSLENLSKVDNIVTHFCHIIKHENEMFVNGKREKFTNWANISLEEMDNHRKKPEYKTEKRILNAEQGMLTPIYFFKTIGTTTKNGTIYEEKLFKMFRDLQDGQDKWYRNIAAVKKQFADIKERYHYSEDWKRATTEFTLASGVTIKLTAEEIMYMRALNIRETGHVNRLCHLLEGGIIVDNDGRLRKFAEKKQEFEEIKQARKKFEEMKHSLEKNEQAEKDYKEALEAWKKEVTDALKKNLTREDLIAIFATLTEEQEQYSEALVEMLSTTGAELGNEVSRELVGIRKFTEKNYIPISVAESFLQFSVDKKSGGAVRLKNRSFTKRTTQNANATVYVRSITDIAAEHMQEMSLYNAMTIPIENLTRVFNYQKPVQEEFTEEGKLQKNTGNSYKEIFEAVYGKRGVKYFEDFLRDINGGNQMQSRDFMSKMMSMFKKSAVTGSLSVAIQQPSAIVRATALIDPKYFVTKPYSKEDYLEMLEYCPVAGIKEIGRFDTGMGLTATEWILDENGGIKEKADALLSYLPGWMDRRTWVYIWAAVKKETADRTNLKGEELLTEAAKRFRDVIDYTQVYDSTLSRSAYMRDKGTGAKMATAFLSEPTLSYNMVRDGLMNAGHDKKQAARSIAAFVGATLLNAMLKTLVTALRHDDEETNYFEVYLSEMPQNFVEDLIIVNSLPVVKDIISIFKGYDVNRSDMTLFSNLYNAFKVISKEDHVPTWDEWFSLIGAVSAFTGIPLNNILKDLTAITKTVIGIGRSPEFSWDVLGQTITETFIGKEDDSVKLYRAIINGNKEIIDRYLEVDEKKVQEYKSQGYSDADALNKAMDNAENSFHSKVVSGLVSEDIRIKEAAEARLDADTETYEELLAELTGLGFDKNDVIKAVEKYISSMEDKTYTQSKSTDLAEYSYEDLFNAINANDMTSAEHIFDKLSEKVSKDTVRGNIREEYAEEMYKSILNKNKTEKQHLIDMFERFREDWHYAATLGLRENDLRVFEAAEARYSGDTAAYERLKADIVADGFDENDVFNAIEVETEKLAPAEEDKESHPEDSYLYEAADLKRYAKEYKLEATKQAIKNFRDSGKKDGKIRESLNDVFKPMYIEAWQSGNYTVIETIRAFLAALDVGYTEKIFSGWEKEANEK